MSSAAIYRIFAVVVCLLLASPAAQAAVYQCTSMTGHTTFQQTPCPKNAFGKLLFYDKYTPPKSSQSNKSSRPSKPLNKRRELAADVPVTISKVNDVPIESAARMFGAYTCLSVYQDEKQAKTYLISKFEKKYTNYQATLDRIVLIFSNRDALVKKYEKSIKAVYKNCKTQFKGY